MIQTYRGGCRCGAVLYEMELDLAAPSRGARSVWQPVVRPSAFRLVTGEDQLSGYQYGDAAMHHFFCIGCGGHAYSRQGESGLGQRYVVDVLALHGRRREPAPVPLSAR